MHALARRGAATLLALVTCGLGAGCLMPRYLAQAAYGQAGLLGGARPLDEVIADPEVPLRTRMLLAEVPEIKAYGASYGLDTRHNYHRYVELDGRAAVWFVGAADPLSFAPRRWCFPIVGFTGLGWFDEDAAVRHRDELIAAGYDAFARPAGAYSPAAGSPIRSCRRCSSAATAAYRSSPTWCCTSRCTPPCWCPTSRSSTRASPSTSPIA
ncbi:MAG: aminopeptidase [Kofleriaceae bacterium]